MPTFKNVSVQIHCPHDPPDDLEAFNWATASHGPVGEHGTQRLRHTPKISSYIPVVTNCPFAVSITILDSYEPKIKGDDRESLAAYVYFDGKAKEETATLLRRGVETWISSRWIEVAEGQLAEREFVFREVGLENFFTSLDINKEKLASERRHSMPAKMDSDDADTKANAPKETAGQIRIDLFRVRCEGPVRRGVWGGMFKDHLSNKDFDDRAVDADNDISHTAGFSGPKPLDKESVSTQSVSHLDPDGVVYASFIFFYRGEHQLRKLGLMGSSGNVKNKRATSQKGSPVGDKSFSSIKGTAKDLIPRGPDFKKFGDFRDTSDPLTHSKGTAQKRALNGLSDDNDIDPLDADSLNRDLRDHNREVMKSEAEARMEEELVQELDRVTLKRGRDGDDAAEEEKKDPSTPQMSNGMFGNFANGPTSSLGGPTSSGLGVGKKDDKTSNPETPAKKRRGSGDADVKSPRALTGLGVESMNGAVGSPPNFGGLLGTGLGESSSMAAAGGGEMEEEL